MNIENKSWPIFEEDEITAVVDVLKSGKVNYWTGEEGKRFEQEFAGFCQQPYAIAVANGTVALEMAIESLGIGEGDEVIVPSRTFMASASSIVRCGAIPVFADVNENSQNITGESIIPALSPKTKAVIVVHLAGWPCEMDEILRYARSNDLFIIEDCAQALGALYKGKPVGSFGDIAAFSFCQDKILTTGGEGGMVVTGSKTIWQKAWSLKDHGKNPQKVFRKKHSPGFRWLHDSIGTNYRMTEMQAALGRVVLKKVPSMISRRKENAALLYDFFRQFDCLRIPQVPDYMSHAFYKFYVFVKESGLKAGWNRDRILQEVNDLGVPCFSGSCSEVYLEKAFTSMGLKPESRLPVARRLGDTSLMFLVDPTISREKIETWINSIDPVFRKASVKG